MINFSATDGDTKLIIEIAQRAVNLANDNGIEDEDEKRDNAVDFGNAMQGAVDEWIKSGELRGIKKLEDYNWDITTTVSDSDIDNGDIKIYDDTTGDNICLIDRSLTEDEAEKVSQMIKDAPQMRKIMLDSLDVLEYLEEMLPNHAIHGYAEVEKVTGQIKEVLNIT